MAALPPSMFGGNGDDENHRDAPYDPEGSVWESQEEANKAFDLLNDWNNGLGFSTEEWFHMIEEVRNIKYDEDGNLESFTFEWASDDGEYSGTGNAHA